MTNAIRLLTNSDKPVRITAYPIMLVAWWDEQYHTYRTFRKSESHAACGWLYRKETDHANSVHAR